MEKILKTFTVVTVLDFSFLVSFGSVYGENRGFGFHLAGQPVQVTKAMIH